MEHLIMYGLGDDTLKRIRNGEKTALIAAADSRKIPHGMVYKGDKLFFSVKENKIVHILLQADAGEAFSSDRLTKEQSTALIMEYKDKYKLTDSDIAPCIGKTFVTFVEIRNIKELSEPFDLNYTKTEDRWLVINSILELTR